MEVGYVQELSGDGSRVKSPWICHLNIGGCNGCDIEVLVAIMPSFDVERFGILLKRTPRYADVLGTGPITKQIGKAIRIYEQMPEKFVIANGSCALPCEVFVGEDLSQAKA